MLALPNAGEVVCTLTPPVSATNIEILPGRISAFSCISSPLIISVRVADSVTIRPKRDALT